MDPINKGTLVRVDPEARRGRRDSEGGVGVVQKKNKWTEDENQQVIVATQDSTNADGESVFDVRYTLDGRLSQDVEKSRVHVANLETIAHCRSATEESHPSILCPQHQPGAMTGAMLEQQQQKHPTTRQSAPLPCRYSHAWLMNKLKETHRHRDGRLESCALVEMKKRKISQKKGWLLEMEQQDNPDPDFKVRLTPAMKTKAMALYAGLLPHDSAAVLVGHAWNVTSKSIIKMYNRMNERNGSTAHKVQKDAGKTLINSEAKRCKTYTGKYVFAKEMHAQNPGTKVMKEEVDEEWEALTEEQQCAYNFTADGWIERGPFLLSEVTKALHSTAGSVSWSTLATLVSGSGNLEMIGWSAI